MTEKKRFTLFEDLDIKDRVTGKIYPPCLDKGLIELIDLLNTLNDENEQLKQIIYDNESVIIGEWSSHIQEDITKLDEAYKSEDINDLIRFCKRS